MCTERRASLAWTDSGRKESRWTQRSSRVSGKSGRSWASRGPRESPRSPVGAGVVRALRIPPYERPITFRTPWGASMEEVPKRMPEEEFLGELSEKTTSVTIKEFTPDGVLISYNLQGTQKGQYDATHMETVDALFKSDGTYEFEARGIDQTDDGDMLIIKAKGTGRQVSPTSVHAEGEAVFQTLSEFLERATTAKGRFEGTYNTSTGEFIAKVFALK